MAQVDPKSLDYSEEMKAYFAAVTDVLTRKFHKPVEEARSLIDRYFSIDVDPLERSLVMHADPEQVAADLAGMHDEPDPLHP